MPLYEYECDACGTRFEVIQKFSDPAVEACRACGKGPVRRLLSSPAIQFKGTGWYITDYAQKAKSDPSTAEAKSDTAKSDAASDSTASKSEAGTKSDAATKSDAGTSKPSSGPSSTAKESKG